jgi:hypothetical protein
MPPAVPSCSESSVLYVTPDLDTPTLRSPTHDLPLIPGKREQIEDWKLVDRTGVGRHAFRFMFQALE